MKIKVDILGSACGNSTTTIATSDDGMYVGFDIKSDCDKVGILAAMLMAQSPVNVEDELNPMTERSVMGLIRSVLTGTCDDCPVPSSIIRSMRVAAGLAPPKDIQIKFTKMDNG
jgi:hypothetical protein